MKTLGQLAEKAEQIASRSGLPTNRLTNCGSCLERVPFAPQSVRLKVVNACNLRCKHCSEINDFDKKPTIPKKLASRLVLEASHLKMKGVQLYGGEPLLYPELVYELSKQIIEHDMDLSINTNGGFATDKSNTKVILGNLDHLGRAYSKKIRLLVSCDGFHQTKQGIPLENIVNIITAINTYPNIELMFLGFNDKNSLGVYLKLQKLLASQKIISLFFSHDPIVLIEEKDTFSKKPDLFCVSLENNDLLTFYLANQIYPQGSAKKIKTALSPASSSAVTILKDLEGKDLFHLDIDQRIPLNTEGVFEVFQDSVLVYGDDKDKVRQVREVMAKNRNLEVKGNSLEERILNFRIKMIEIFGSENICFSKNKRP